VIALPLYALAGAQALDLLTFTAMVRSLGLAAEANPIVGLVYAFFGMGGAIFGKAAITLLASSVALICQPKRRGLGLVVVTIGVLVGSYGAWTNLNTLIMNGG
jgi:hypothetical protein